jgi:ribosomal-protein-alanine N-acetyltransferase
MIVPYEEHFRSEAIDLLAQNTPRYFAPEEKPDFLRFLNDSSKKYFLYLVEGQPRACGGYSYKDGPSKAHLCWDFSHPLFQRKGIGSALVNYRLNKILEEATATTIVVRTSQFAHRFYQKLGFALLYTEHNFWAKGFDLYHMELKTSPLQHAHLKK